MIPGSLTQTTAAIFTLRFLGAVPSTALAQAINHPGRLARSSIALRTTAAEQKHASSEIHLLTTPVLVRLRCNCIRDQMNILFRTQWPLLVPEQHNSSPQSRLFTSRWAAEPSGVPTNLRTAFSVLPANGRLAPCFFWPPERRLTPGAYFPYPV